MKILKKSKNHINNAINKYENKNKINYGWCINIRLFMNDKDFYNQANIDLKFSQKLEKQKLIIILKLENLYEKIYG